MKTSLNVLHHQGYDWLRELEFYKDELAILTTRLEEVAGKNTATDIQAQVEHFQNKFIMLREQLDTLKHDIGASNHEVEQVAATKPTHIHEKFMPELDKLQGRVKDFGSSVADIRFEFNTFLAKIL